MTFGTLLFDASNHFSALLLSPELSFWWFGLEEKVDGGLAWILAGLATVFLTRRP